jgi:hypothetical protein
MHLPLQSSIAELARDGAAVVVATRDSELRPCIARAWGIEILDGDGAMRLCVEAPSPSRTRDNLRPGAEIATTLSRPSTYRSAQVKGVVAELRQPLEADLALVDEHHAAFTAEAERVGLTARHVARALDRGALLSVSVTVHELYDQTPGPAAGGPL